MNNDNIKIFRRKNPKEIKAEEIKSKGIKISLKKKDDLNFLPEDNTKELNKPKDNNKVSSDSYRGISIYFRFFFAFSSLLVVGFLFVFMANKLFVTDKKPFVPSKSISQPIAKKERVRLYEVSDIIYSKIEDGGLGSMLIKVRFKGELFTFFLNNKPELSGYSFMNSFSIYEYIENQDYYLCPIFDEFSHDKMKLCYPLADEYKEVALYLTGKKEIISKPAYKEKRTKKYEISKFDYEEIPGDPVKMLYTIKKAKRLHKSIGYTKNYYGRMLNYDFVFDKKEALSDYDMSKKITIYNKEGAYYFCPYFEQYDDSKLSMCYLLAGENLQKISEIIN